MLWAISSTVVILVAGGASEAYDRLVERHFLDAIAFPQLFRGSRYVWFGVLFTLSYLAGLLPPVVARLRPAASRHRRHRPRSRRGRLGTVIRAMTPHGGRRPRDDGHAAVAGGYLMRVQGLLRAKGDEVETIDPTATVAEVVDALVRRGIGALVVSADGEHIDGIVSERDIVQSLAAHGADLLGRPVSTVMTDFVHTCTAETTVHDLMSLMTTERVRHVPVVDGDRLVGIVSIGDVVKSRILELEHEMQAVHEYITHGR